MAYRHDCSLLAVWIYCRLQLRHNNGDVCVSTISITRCAVVCVSHALAFAVASVFTKLPTSAAAHLGNATRCVCVVVLLVDKKNRLSNRHNVFSPL
mmetsp:Transcript_15107/g.25976  ORF Transcript_15107/g.25976 Transcript_15107/m.25976 type:complete len:96 (+) Transcript_15107:1661-1948(+)